MIRKVKCASYCWPDTLSTLGDERCGAVLMPLLYKAIAADVPEAAALVRELNAIRAEVTETAKQGWRSGKRVGRQRRGGAWRGIGGRGWGQRRVHFSR
jgi:hypothetical protein